MIPRFRTGEDVMTNALLDLRSDQRDSSRFVS